MDIRYPTKLEMIVILGCIDTIALTLLRIPYYMDAGYGHRESPTQMWAKSIGYLITLSFIAGMGFSIAVLICLYVKHHVSWKD